MKSQANAPAPSGRQGGKSPLFPAKPPSGASPALFRGQDLLLGFLLVVATLLVYQPAWYGHILFDDNGHLTKPALRSWTGLLRIWTQVGATQQYYPLAHSAFWAEQKLWGDSNARLPPR